MRKQNCEGRASNGDSGSNVLTGGSGNDKLNGGANSDTLNGGAGSDSLNGDSGNDSLIYGLAENAGATDVYTGGSGIDTVRIDLTQAEWMSASVEYQLARYYQHLLTVKTNPKTGEVSNGAASDFTFDFGNGSKLTVQMMEKLEIAVGGVIVTNQDQPVIKNGPQAAGVVEDGDTDASASTAQSASGSIAFFDLDLSDSHVVSVATPAGAYGALTAGVSNALGDSQGTVAWSYQLNNAAVQFLAAGQTRTEVFTVRIADANNAASFAETQITLTITGTNDVPTITSAAQAGTVTEAINNSADEINNVTHQATGTLAFTDVDLADVHGASVSGNANPGYRGTLSANIANSATGDGAGSIGWTFAVSDGALDDLAQGQILTQVYTVAVSDGHGGTSSQNVVITITGAADNAPPVVTGAVTLAPIAEDSGARLITQAQLLANSSDVDGPSLTAINLAISAGNGSLSDNGNGTWNYTPALNDNTAVTFSYSVTDGVAAPVATSATLDITPVNDAPVNTVPVGAPTVPSPFSGPAIADPLSGTGQLIGPYSDSQNLASVTNGAAVAVVSSVLSGYAALHDAAGINDGYYGNASSWIPDSPGWLKIDLGQVKLFDTLTFGRDRLGVYNDRAPGTYTISVATTDAYATGNSTSDTSEYTTVFNGTVNSLSFLQTIVSNFTPVNARYIKIDFTNGGVAVDEVQVYSVNPTAEDTAKVFSVANGNAISISDVDVGADTEKVTLSVTNGTLTLAGTSGLGFTAGDGSSDTTMTFSGTTTAINTALNGLSYAPTANFNGNATLTITTNDQGNTGTDPGLTDGPSGEEDTDTVAITVTAVNDAPVAVANTISISEDTATAGLAATLIANDSDVDGDTLTITAVANATNGSIALNGGNPIFTPTAQFSGLASFDYTISDSHGGTATATATVNVAPVADMPSLTSNGATASGNVGTAIVLPLMTALPSVDTDGSESLRVVLSDFPVGTTFSSGLLNADGITWRITSAFSVPNLATQPLQMTLPAGYIGTFALHVQAATLDQMTGFPNSQAFTPMQDIIVTVAPVNVAPVAVADTRAATEDTPVTYTAAQLLGNDTDVDNTNAQLSIASVTSGTGGTAVLNAGGTVTFTPSANFNGPASFTYKASDGAAQSNSATVTVNVAAVNDAPVAVADTLSATEDTQVIYTAAQLLGNDTDVDNTNAQLSIASVTSGTGGTAVRNGNGTVTFTPNANFNGPASFTYKATDGTTQSNAGTVTVNVAAVNDNPTVTAGAQSVQLVELGVVGGTASANRTLTKGDVDSGDSAVYDGAALTTGGWATSNGGSTYTKTGTYGTATLTTGTNVVSYALDNADTDTNGLAANAGVSDSFTVYVKDGSTGTASTAVNFAITGTNDAPTNLALSANLIVENLPGATIGLLSASDPDAGATLTYTIRAGFDGALFAISGDELRVGGTGLDYEASPTRTVMVRATDNNGGFVDSTFVINVIDRAEVTLTTGTDIVPASSDNTQILGFSATLNASDNLDGGSGTDSLVLYGAGTFNLRTLAGYTGIEQVQLVNFTGSQAELILRDGTTSAVTSIGTGQTTVRLQGTAAASTIQGGDGVNIYYFEGTGTAASIQTASNNDQIYFSNATAWNPGITIDGGLGGGDSLDFRVANATFDLRSATLTNVENYSLSNSNITALIDADAITGVVNLNGSTGSKFVTGDTALNLANKSVNTVTIESSNATGTVFTVNSSNTAFQVFGGPGSDTIQTSSFAFTAGQRDAIFATSSIETIIDSSGTYPAPALPANTYKLTGGADLLTLTAADETINGSLVTLNSTDNLNGGGGTDRLTLYGGGTFNLRTLAGFTNIEQVQLVNYTNSQARLDPRDDTTIAVTSIGTGPTFVYMQGTAAASTIQGGDGSDLYYFQGTGMTPSVLMGASNDQIYFWNASAWNPNMTINGESGTDYLYFYMSSATIDLRSAALTNVEYLYAQGSNLTVQIDADAILGVSGLYGASGSRFVTADATLNLTNKSVNAVTIESSNPTGTTFTVNSIDTALRVSGGPGSDTIQTSSFAFTAAQRNAIFAASSIETIIDTSGTYPAPALPANTYKLTRGTDVLTLTTADETINATSAWLDGTDNLNGGGGTDTLALYGDGTFNLRALAGFTNIEQVQLVNYTNAQPQRYLRDGTMSAVTSIGTGSTIVYMQGTAAASTIQGGDGSDTYYFQGTGTASSIQTGANSDQMYFWNASAWNPNITINGESGSDYLLFYMSGVTIDLRSAALTNVEYLYAQGSNLTVQIDADAILGVSALYGASGSKFVTADATLNLTNKSVGTVTIVSSNATGTTFTVTSSATAFQVLGGPGSDTIETSSFAFTAAQRDAIFNGSFVDIISDTSGFYGNEQANTITGTAAADNISGGGGGDTIIGAGGVDSLSGGAGGDTFVYQLLSDRGTTGDVITDFTKTGGDVLNLHDVLGTFAGITPTTHANAFSGGFLQFVDSNGATAGGDTLVQVDSDGSGDGWTTLATLTGVVLLPTDLPNFVL